MLVIEGLEGTGKTTLLMVAAKKFGGKKKVAYVDCKVLQNDVLQSIITGVQLQWYTFQPPARWYTFAPPFTIPQAEPDTLDMLYCGHLSSSIWKP